MQNILPVLCFLAGFGLAWLIWRGRITAREADLKARLETERTAAAEKLALLEETRQKLSGAFAELAAEALASNNQAFLDRPAPRSPSRERAATRRQQAIAEMVTPVRESLTSGPQRFRS